MGRIDGSTTATLLIIGLIKARFSVFAIPLTREIIIPPCYFIPFNKKENDVPSPNLLST